MTIQITFNFSDIAAAAALFAKLNGHEIGAMSATNVPGASPVTVAHSTGVSADEKTAVLLANEKALANTKDEPAPKSDKQAAAQTAKPASTAGSATTPAADAATPSAPAYADLQKQVLVLHALDPNAAVLVAKALGFDNFKPLKEESNAGRRAEAVAAVAAKIAEIKGA